MSINCKLQTICIINWNCWFSIFLWLSNSFAVLPIVLGAGLLFVGMASVLSSRFSCSIIPCSSGNSILLSSIPPVANSCYSITNWCCDKWTTPNLFSSSLLSITIFPDPDVVFSLLLVYILAVMILLSLLRGHTLLLTVFSCCQLFL